MKLEIENLLASVEETQILKGFSIRINPGEIHAIMGPNGAGKSTLAKALAGHPSYEVQAEKCLLNGKNLLEMEPSERSHQGLFMSFQYPLEVAGISNYQFLLSVFNAKQKAQGKQEYSKEEFSQLLNQILQKFNMNPDFLQRDLNSGFSGGEKKRNEILQMAVLDPSVAVLDETDSGLDIDALKVVADGINEFMSPDKSLLLITHYQRLLDYVKPDVVHVMKDGKIVMSGGPELALELEEKGYDWIEKQQEISVC